MYSNPPEWFVYGLCGIKSQLLTILCNCGKFSFIYLANALFPILDIPNVYTFFIFPKKCFKSRAAKIAKAEPKE